jgi:hypothetical protein
MGRYDVGKDSTGEVIPESVSTKPRNPNIIPMEVKFEINAGESLWYIKIKKEDNWEFLQRVTTQSGEITEQYVTFETVNEAQEWCEKIGLL